MKKGAGNMLNSRAFVLQKIGLWEKKIEELKEKCKQNDTDYNKRLLTYAEDNLKSYQGELSLIEEREYENELKKYDELVEKCKELLDKGWTETAVYACFDKNTDWAPDSIQSTIQEAQKDKKGTNENAGGEKL